MRRNWILILFYLILFVMLTGIGIEFIETPDVRGWWFDPAGLVGIYFGLDAWRAASAEFRGEE